MIGTNNPTQFKYLRDVRWVIIGYFLIQLFFISQPPLEPAHAWRQSVTNMIARNLSEGNGNLFYPKIDYGGASNGIMGSEFPVMQYLISLGYRFLGFNHWFGRLINLLVTCLGVYAFSLIIRRFFSYETAYFAAVSLLLSLWLMYGRKSMPDTFSVSLAMMGTEVMLRFLERGKWCFWLSGTLLMALAVLSKIPALLVLSPTVLFLFDRSFSKRNRFLLMIGGAVAMLPVFGWYFIWVPYLVALDNNPLFFPRSLMQGWNEIRSYPVELVQQFAFHSFFSYLAFGLYIAGLVMVIRNKNIHGIMITLISGVVMAVFVLKTGMVFPLHSYYMVPFVPVMAILVGYFLSHIKRNIALLVLLGFAIESIANQQDDFRIRESAEVYLQLEQIADSLGSDNKKIVCNGGDNPQMIYFLNRVGWSLEDNEITPGVLDSLNALGAKYYYQLDGEQAFNFNPVYNSDRLTVFDLDEPITTPGG